jgi:hypothetical protein
MRFTRTTCVSLLLGLGLGLCAGNLWFTAARSTIPLTLAGQLVDKEQRIEPRAGIDDVFLLTILDDDASQPRVVRVDEFVYQAVEAGQRLEKQRWSAMLQHGEQVTLLEWSLDFRRMWMAMPLVMATMALLVMIDARGGRPAR